MKSCFKCNRPKPESEFYSHSGMLDGRLNKCKQCAKSDAKRNYADKRELKAMYDRERNKLPQRKEARKAYALNSRLRSPEKKKARTAVGNAIRDGRLIRKPCRVCGGKAQAHHHDYSKPLEVDWLCFRHHRELEHGQTVIAA